MFGGLAFGSVRRMRELIGAILTTTTTSKAGRCMKAIGTTKIMAIIMTTVTVVITTKLSRAKGSTPDNFVVRRGSMSCDQWTGWAA